MYEYEAIVTSVYDGDTVTVDIDLGLGVWKRGERIRLARIDAPEIRGAERPEGLLSRDFLRSLILGNKVQIVTIQDKKGKYGRYIGDIYLLTQEEATFGLCVNDILVENGFAEYRQY